MSLMDLIPTALRALPRDAVVLFLTRFLRLFAYGALSVVLVFYLVSLGLSTAQVGLLLTLTLAGDIAISLLLTTRADQMGRRHDIVQFAKRCWCFATERSRKTIWSGTAQEPRKC